MCRCPPWGFGRVPCSQWHWSRGQWAPKPAVPREAGRKQSEGVRVRCKRVLHVRACMVPTCACACWQLSLTALPSFAFFVLTRGHSNPG